MAMGTLIVFSLNIKPQYIPARYFSFCVLLTVLLVTLSIRSLQGELFITDAQYIAKSSSFFDLLALMTKMERPVFDKFNSATNYSLRILRAIEIIENRKLC